jgi:toxin YoeB
LGLSSYQAIFTSQFREDLRHFIENEKRVALKVCDLIEAVLRDPKDGPGHPEQLKHDLAGCWSRRITREHRLVYRIDEDTEAIYFLQARYHYQ